MILKNNESWTKPICPNEEDMKEFNDQVMKQSIKEVYDALCEKGYNPNAQIVGFIMSGDPTYITTHKNARIIMSRMDRYEVLRVVLEDFFKENKA